MAPILSNAVQRGPLQSREKRPVLKANLNLRPLETESAAPLQNLENGSRSTAKANLHGLEHAAKLLRQAIAKAGLTPKEASALVDVNDASQFNRMLDGIEKFPIHLLLNVKARAILRELLIQSMVESGECEVERTIRIKEK